MANEPPLIHLWNHPHSIISTIAFPHRKLLFAGTQDSKILCFDLCTYNLVKTIHLGEDTDNFTKTSVLGLSKSQDEKLLFSAGTDSLVRVWSIGTVPQDDSIEAKELVTIYSLMDIGDIFSLAYLDAEQTLVFGCQNASMLYVDNFMARKIPTRSAIDFDKLPHRRYNKFFDSTGPGGGGGGGGGGTGGAGGGVSNLPSVRSASFISPEGNNLILQVPSENIITYAHNGFIYSICRINGRGTWLSTHFEQYATDPNVSFFVSSAGDGISKIWALLPLNSQERRVGHKVQLLTEFDNEESVFCQFVEYPFLYCGLSGGIIKIWDLNINQLVTSLKTPYAEDIMSITVYKDNVFATHKQGITRFHQGNVNFWNAHQGLVLSSEILRKSCTSNRIDRMVTGGNDGSLALWNINEWLNGTASPGGSAPTEEHSLPSGERRNSWTEYQQIQLDNDHMIATLREFISYQTVSQLPEPQNIIDSRRCANFLQNLFTKLGANHCGLIPVSTGSNPVVLAQFKGNAAAPKRILWYGHYDVISADHPSQWDNDPFTLTCENGYLKGRGVSDNKGPLLAAIFSVAELFQKGYLNNDIIFLVEGEEENGSRGFREILLASEGLLNQRWDWILFSNSYWLDQKVPCLNYGLRGVINAEITISSDEPDRHSGVDGGVYREPSADLICITSKLQADDGTIRIPHFHDAVQPVTEQERQDFRDIISRAEIDNRTTVEHLVAKWTQPSISFTKFNTSGPGNATVISQRASLVVSIRLVPPQDVRTIKQLLIDYITQSFAALRSRNHLHISILNEAEPWLGDPHNTCYEILREELHDTWGIDPLFIREGGSIPCIRFLERQLNAPAVQIPCGQSTDNAHLDNENLRIKNWYNMRAILTKVFNRL
ncbi:FAEL154Cp [Eremothecium gossypii FDAG1]|nr:FAEL154Cp [Eremothecium gossypii FDAG1]